MTAVPHNAFTASPGSHVTEPPVEVTAQIGYAWVLDGIKRYLGFILLALGFLCLILGWYGAANQSVVAEQIPYVISGGLLGLAFIVLGGRILLIEDLRHDSGRLDRLELMMTELHTLLLQRAEAAGVSPNGHAIDSTANLDMLYVISGSKTYHQPGCPLLENKRSNPTTMASAAKRGLKPCLLCEPADVSV